MRSEFPQGLKPNSFLAGYGAAKAAPLQNSRPLGFGFGWSWWALLPLALACLAIAVPYALTHNLLLPGFALKRGFALVCHQQPERSFWIFGAPIAVCARCLGIYCGAAVGLLLRTSRRTAVHLLLAATALNVADAVTEMAGFHGNWIGLCLPLGLALGISAGLLISSALPNSGRWQSREAIPSQPS